MKKVLAFGTFDILHEGHRDFIKQAKEQGDCLILVLARDLTIREVKGRKPYFTESIRKAKLESLPEVDQVILGSLGEKYSVINEVNPNVIALGYDQTAFTDKLPAFLEKQGLKTEIIRLKPYHKEVYKSSIIRKGLTSGNTHQ